LVRVQAGGQTIELIDLCGPWFESKRADKEFFFLIDLLVLGSHPKGISIFLIRKLIRKIGTPSGRTTLRKTVPRRGFLLSVLAILKVQMKRFFQSHHFIIGVAAVAIIAVVLMMLGVGRAKPKEIITATVEQGTVRQLVSVSGIADAKQTADLSFPMSGFIDSVAVKVGDVVKAGDILVSQNTAALLADQQDALATLQKAKADKDELIAGPRSEARVVTAETIALKEAALKTAKENGTEQIASAERLLRSDGLTAYTDKATENATAPIISGSYTCDKEGSYNVRMYRSDSLSGYSYEITGIETGIFPASTNQPAPLGTCGLRILFDSKSIYSSTIWHIEIPNTKSLRYVANKNALELTKIQTASAIALAEQELALTKASADSSNAPARTEALTRAEASITQAEARLARISSEISDRVLRAPFDGTITDISAQKGEVAGATPIVTVLAENAFDLTARIPEIDIGKLKIGQRVEMVFDAKPSDTLMGTISFISLKATEIDGVSYYEAYVQLDNKPDWLRSGLNAYINIILSEKSDALRIPKRFLIKENTAVVVLKRNGQTNATTTVGVDLEGDDGFVAITGLNSGDTVVAP
jgi:RND family efflux transporter MFP subunit